MKTMLPKRAMALFATFGLTLLTCLPVCGSPADVDPQACCAGHESRHQSSEQDCGAPAKEHDPQQCCEQGRSSYPVAALKAASSIPLPVDLGAPLLDAAVVPHPSPGRVFPAAPAGRDSGPPLKSLYDWHSAYRI